MNITPVVKQLLIINIIFFIGSQLVAPANDLFALSYFENNHFRFWQPLTHMFMHANVMHIAFNMFALYSFGSTLEHFWGGKKFLFFYISCGLGAMLLHSMIDYFTVQNLLSNTSTSGVLSTIAAASPIGMLTNLFTPKTQAKEESKDEVKKVNLTTLVDSTIPNAIENVKTVERLDPFKDIAKQNPDSYYVKANPELSTTIAVPNKNIPELTPQQQVNAMIDRDFSKSKQLAQNLSNISTNFSSETSTSIQTPSIANLIPSKLIPELSTTVAIPNKNNPTKPNVSSEPPLVPYPIPNNSIQWGDKNIVPLTKDYSSGKNSDWVPSIVPTKVDVQGQSNNFTPPLITPTGNVTYGQSIGNPRY